MGVDPTPIFPWNNFAVGASTASVHAEPHLPKKLMFQPLGNIQLSFSRMGDPGADLPKGGIIPTLPMPCLFGDKIVFYGDISQVSKPGK